MYRSNQSRLPKECNFVVSYSEGITENGSKHGIVIGLIKMLSLLEWWWYCYHFQRRKNETSNISI